MTTTEVLQEGRGISENFRKGSINVLKRPITDSLQEGRGIKKNEARINKQHYNGSMKNSLQEHIPSFVLSLFEDRLKDQGLGLHELTVLAATLEHLIHDEAVSENRGP